MNITLIGMPGAGKSLIGKKLADRLSYGFLDIDRVLERMYSSLPLPRLLEILGTESFLDEEARTAIRETGGIDKLVISPGGSIVYRALAIDHLKRISTVIYLEAPLDIIVRRMGAAPRGIVLAPSMTLAELYAERTPLYKNYADHTIDGSRSADIVLADILNILRLPR